MWNRECLLTTIVRTKTAFVIQYNRSIITFNFELLNFEGFVPERCVFNILKHEQIFWQLA